MSQTTQRHIWMLFALLMLMVTDGSYLRFFDDCRGPYPASNNNNTVVKRESEKSEIASSRIGNNRRDGGIKNYRRAIGNIDDVDDDLVFDGKVNLTSDSVQFPRQGNPDRGEEQKINDAGEFSAKNHDDSDDDGDDHDDDDHHNNSDEDDDDENDDDEDDKETLARINPGKASNTVTGGRPNHPERGQAGGNVVEFSLFVALRPHALSVGYILQLVQVVLLNMVSSEQYRFRLGDDRKVVLIDYVLLLQTKQPEIDLIHQSRLLSQIVHRGQNRWWWRYLFRYNVFRADTGGPLSATRRNEVQALVEQYIQEAIELHTPTMIELMEELNFHVDEGFRIEVELPSDLNVTDPPASSVTELSPPPILSSGDMGITTTVTTHPCVSCPESSERLQAPCRVAGDVMKLDSTSALDVDPCTSIPSTSWIPTEPFALPPSQSKGEWDWRRYVGLGLLVVTVSGTVCLAHLAALRRNRRNQIDVWSNLSSEQGVNELLRMGWKIDGSIIEIYDKMNSGYRDDDSLFLGGFEQRETHGTATQSETTPCGSTRIINSGIVVDTGEFSRLDLPVATSAQSRF